MHDRARAVPVLMLTVMSLLMFGACGDSDDTPPGPVPGIGVSPSPSASPSPSPSPEPSPTDEPAPSPEPSPEPTTSPTPSPTGAVPTFGQISQQIVQPRCASCHNEMRTYEGTMQSVVAGNPEQSSLYTSVVNGSMPPGDPLPSSQVQMIRDWIQAGALNN